jgi:8-hydroxy-5-deazaflavin:NADPH oxidoreductase
MTHPEELGGNHAVFVAGNDESDRRRVRAILEGSFGWNTVIDLGDLTAARATESYMHLWLRLWAHTGHAQFNIAIVSGP